MNFEILSKLLTEEVNPHYTKYLYFPCIVIKRKRTSIQNYDFKGLCVKLYVRVNSKEEDGGFSKKLQKRRNWPAIQVNR